MSLHCKSYNLKSLMTRVSKPAEKWRISALSFENEYQYLAHAQGMNSQITQFLDAAGGQPETVYSHRQVNGEDLFDHQYTFLTQYLHHESFKQAHQLDLQQAQAAMRWLARFHAFWWIPSTQHQLETTCDTSSSSPSQSWPSSVFKRGAWWRKELRPSVRYERLPAVFAGLCAAFPDLFSDMDTEGGHAAMRQLADRWALVCRGGRKGVQAAYWVSPNTPWYAP